MFEHLQPPIRVRVHGIGHHQVAVGAAMRPAPRAACVPATAIAMAWAAW